MTKKLLHTISILLLISCNTRQDKKVDSNPEDDIINVFLNSPCEDIRIKNNLTEISNELLRVAYTKEIINLGLTAKLHYITPQCGGCWEYELLDISDKQDNHYIFPIMDAYWYNYSNTINNSWTGDTLVYDISYKEEVLSNNILSNTTLQFNLNNIFSKDIIFSNFSDKDTSDIAKAKLLIDELLNNFILYPTYRDCKFYNDNKPITECVNANRIHLSDTLKLHEHLIKKQKFDKDSAIKSRKFKNQLLEVKRVIDNLKNRSEKYAYYWFYDAIYEFEISEKANTKRPFVKVNLVNKEWFTRYMW